MKSSTHLNLNLNLNLLFKYKLSTQDSLNLISDSVRDKAGLNVFKCSNSGVIVLEDCITSEEYYKENAHYSYRNIHKIKTLNGKYHTKSIDDDLRRFESYKNLIKDSNLLDFGCGSGGFLQHSSKNSNRSVGIEINNIHRNWLNENGFKCLSHLSELGDEKFDIITLNHVFEHLNDPINTLIQLQKKLDNDGTIIIEVPHARDILIETFNLKSYKDFTFWSEHLLLHTRKSLESFAINSGLEVLKIEGIQRYPISNHYYWLNKGMPSGHDILKNLNDNEFHRNYEKFLNDIDQTDTLVGYFKMKNKKGK